MSDFPENKSPLQITIGKTAPIELQPSQVVSGSATSELAIAFDTTGSMAPYAEGLADCISSMVAELERTGILWSALIVPFGDLRVIGDTVDAEGPWCKDFEEFSRQLANRKRNSGGGNLGESSLEAMDACLKRLGTKSAAAKVLLVITDEPAHEDGISAERMASSLKEADVLCFVVAPRHYRYYREFAEATGGKFIDIASTVDLSEVISAMSSLGRQIAARSAAVIKAGGSAQKLLAIEGGK
jgi:hypothetical protein